MKLRAARPEDLDTITQLQLASWRTAYRGLVGDDFLDNKVPGLLAQRWAVLPGPKWRVDAVWQDDVMVGFASLDLAHDGGAYVDNLHVLPRAKGQGVGRILMARAAAHVIEEKQEKLWLTVMADNMPARAFYTRIGGQELAATQESMLGEPVMALPVVWDGDRLAKLAKS